MHDYNRLDICPKSENINKEVSCNYILSIQLSDEWFTYCILDTRSNKYIALSSYSFGNKKSKKTKNNDNRLLTGKLGEMIAQLQWLKNPFKKVIVIYINDRSVIIPNLLFDKTHPEKYFYFLYNKKENEKLCFDYIAKLNAYNLYAIPDLLEDELKKIFKSFKITHYTGTLVMSIFSLPEKYSAGVQVFINVQFDQVDLIITKSGKLIYINSFRVLSDEDLIFYLFWVINKLELDPLAIKAVLMGEIEKGSLIEKEIVKYISDVSFISRNDDFNYIDVFDNIPSHFYYNLLNANRCV